MKSEGGGDDEDGESEGGGDGDSEDGARATDLPLNTTTTSMSTISTRASSARSRVSSASVATTVASSASELTTASTPYSFTPELYRYNVLCTLVTRVHKISKKYAYYNCLKVVTDKTVSLNVVIYMFFHLFLTS